MPLKRVMIESPFRGNRPLNEAYARSAALDCILFRSEAAWGSHMIWPQFLNDDMPRDRQLGVEAGYAWSDVADLIAFYTDLGWSNGMLIALHRCLDNRLPFELRSLEGKINYPHRENFTEAQWARIQEAAANGSSD